MVKDEYLNLSNWLDILKDNPNPKKLIIDYEFPTDKICQEYLSTIEDRSDDEVFFLLRKFLISTGNLGQDSSLIAFWKSEHFDFNKHYKSHEYIKRFVRPEPNWEGLTWVLDLVIDRPLEAINVIDNYFNVHIGILPEGRFRGLLDAIAIIRAKYIDFSHPQKYLLGLQPRDFEKLIEKLYKKIGYNTTLTQQTRDGGFDILAEKISDEGKEEIIIECKRYSKKIGVKVVREFYGVLQSARKTKGLIITSSSFTREAKRFANTNPQIMLIDYLQLNRLLNTQLGSNWPFNLSYINHDSRNI